MTFSGVVSGTGDSGATTISAGTLQAGKGPRWGRRFSPGARQIRRLVRQHDYGLG
jgi:autotransporter-associated beta strand protein